MNAILGWMRERLGLDVLHQAVTSHKVPRACGEGRTAWMYVFGNATVVMFLVQVVTGAALATLYAPSPAVAHESLQQINEQVTLGWLLRAVHFFSASAMVTLMVCHFLRVFLTAAYKYPREATWMFGVLLSVLTFAMAFSGQLLRWDENGLYGVVVAAEFIRRVPLVGDGLARFVLAGESVTGATLSRFFALHVFILPALIVLCIGVHVFLVVHHGISEPPKAGRKVDPKTYRAWYAKLKDAGVTYWPNVAWREAVFALGAFALVVTLAFAFGPRGPGAPPDPSRVGAAPEPDWYLLWWYALLWLKPRGTEAWVMVYLPLLLVGGLLLLPVLAPKGERSPFRRPWAVLVVVLGLLAFAALTVIGARAPWLPETTEPLTSRELGTSDPTVLAGAHAYFQRGCPQCHVIRGRGGTFGPDLTAVSRRLPSEEIALRIMNGRGDMPGYREILDREELGRMIVFFARLPPGGKT